MAMQVPKGLVRTSTSPTTAESGNMYSSGLIMMRMIMRTRMMIKIVMGMVVRTHTFPTTTASDVYSSGLEDSRAREMMKDELFTLATFQRGQRKEKQQYLQIDVATPPTESQGFMTV